MVTNLDELRRLRETALVKGAGSKAWIDFASTMLDSFPHLYETAQRMNGDAERMRHALRTLIGETEDSDYMSHAEQEAMARRALTPNIN